MDNVSIKLKVGGVEIPSHPVFGDDIKLKFSKEENQVFLRSKIDGKIKFTGEDFDFIASCSHDTTFTLEVYRGASLFGSGTFLKSDCALNYDDRACEVKLTVTDRYEKFLANYDNKYNLVRLAPEIQQLTLNRRAVLQIYGMGDKKITNIVGNMAFEQDAKEESDDATIRGYGFTNVGLLSYFVIKSSDIQPAYADYYSSAVGRYFLATPYGHSNIGTYIQEGGRWKITITFSQSYHLVLEDTQSSWFAEVYFNTLSDGDRPQLVYNNTIVAYTTFNSDTWLYARVLLPKSVSGATQRSDDDICDVDKVNYPYVIKTETAGIDIVSRLMPMVDRSATPTEWGYDGNNYTYFMRPTMTSSQISAGDDTIPICRSFWNKASHWLRVDTSLISQMEAYNDPYTLKDTYPVSSAIKRLLAEVDSDIAYEATSVFSEFFHGSNAGLDSAIQSPKNRDSKLYVTPITNVKKTRYEQAAQRGDITLKQILDMLRSVYQCYWFIDDSNRLRIEHITYFKGGHKYIIGSAVADINVSRMKDMPNGLSWAFGTNEADYKRSNCPSRYEFSWGDECTEQFNGEAIDIEDSYADGSKKEKVSVSNFTADIDYTIINPANVSDDIYALIEAPIDSHVVAIPNVRLSSQTPIYAMQNGYCSFLFAEKTYWVYDLGGWKANAGGVYLSVKDTRRFVQQKIGIPFDGLGVQIASVLTAQTDLGVGSVDEMEVNADTLYAKTKLLLNDNDLTRYVTLSDQAYSWFVKNNYNKTLAVRYARKSTYGTVEIRTTSVSAGSTVYLGIAPEAYSCVLLSAYVDSSFQPIGDFVKMDGGAMSVLIGVWASSYVALRINGISVPSYTWGYLCVQCKKRSILTVISHTEAGYDFGYIAKKPHADWQEIRTPAPDVLAKASGDDVNASALVEAGEVVYLGYARDASGSAYGDYVSFELREA